MKTFNLPARDRNHLLAFYSTLVVITIPATLIFGVIGTVLLAVFFGYLCEILYTDYRRLTIPCTLAVIYVGVLLSNYSTIGWHQYNYFGTVVTFSVFGVTYLYLRNRKANDERTVK